MIFFDASAVVKVYVAEQGSSVVRGAINRMAGKVYLTPHVVLETLSTLAKQLRVHIIAKQEYRRARSSFLNELGTVYTVAEVREAVFASAYGLVDQNRQMSVGALDVLHVASVLDLQAALRTESVVLASADRGLLSLAKAVGVKTFNPELDPLAALLSATR